MATARKLPIGYYVYTITVDGVVRYIGKGKALRLYCHMKEVRSRLNRDYRLQNIGSRLHKAQHRATAFPLALMTIVTGGANVEDSDAKISWRSDDRSLAGHGFDPGLSAERPGDQSDEVREHRQDGFPDSAFCPLLFLFPVRRCVRLA
jgi:hypothetical protein